MLKSYLIPRISQWGITIFIGITVTFIIPRMIPGDPVERTLSSLTGPVYQLLETVSKRRPWPITKFFSYTSY